MGIKRVRGAMLDELRRVDELSRRSAGDRDEHTEMVEALDRDRRKRALQAAMVVVDRARCP